MFFKHLKSLLFLFSSSSVRITFIAFFVGSLSLSAKAQKDVLAQGFVSPADSMQTTVYWYWFSDNISREGVVKDLQSMKKVGINRAFIGNIAMGGPFGKVKIFSDEWWSILHTALKTATELNIEIGIFNSPGWTQSGGPWVKPDQTMRYLTSSELRIKGPQKFSQKLQAPHELFQTVKVLAYPEPKDDQLYLNTQNAVLSSVPATSGLHKIVDGDQLTGINFPAKGEFTINLQSSSDFTARSLLVRTTKHPLKAKGILQYQEISGLYKTLSEFDIDRSNPQINVGFEPYAPVVVSFPVTKARKFRLIFRDVDTTGGLSEFELSAGPRVERYSEKTFAKMHQTPLPLWHEYQWPLQAEVDDLSTVIDASRVIDLTTNVSADGTVKWDVPDGNWIILQTGMTPTGIKNSPASPEGTGYEIDKMSKQHIATHFDSFIGEILKRIPKDDRKSFKVVVADSYETGGQNFTDDFLSAFQNNYGYDPTPFLPVYNGKVVNSQLASDRFLWDVRRLVADKVAYDYVGGLREASHKNGLRLWLENYGHWGFPAEFLQYGGQADEVAGEFWSQGDLGNIENRAASSAGHIYGKNKISAESNTSASSPFSLYPALLKQRADRFFAEGINNTLLHVYISQPYEDKNPGVNTWFGTEFNRKNTWFSQMDVYTAYLKRTNYMLQQGINIADVAYFIGEDAPKMTGVADPPLPLGYQFDYINAEVIEKYMTVKDGLLTLPHGTQYRVLVLPKLQTMRPQLLEKLRQLVADGAVILGPAPKRSPSLQDQPQSDDKVKAIAAELWGVEVDNKVQSRKYKRGTVLNGMNMEKALASIDCIPDCKVPEDSSIHYGHRISGSSHIYFLSNQTNETKQITPAFRVTGMQPELWEATTGYIRNLPDYVQNNKSTAVPLKLEPYESVFVVFRKKAVNVLNKKSDKNFAELQVVNELKGPWKVKFNAAQRGPEQPVVFNTLQDWTTSAVERIKYYSGTAVYSSNINLTSLPKNKKFYINLGTVTAMAKVRVNGKYAGGVWTHPYRLDITPLLKSGKNTIDIEVVNTWVNRLIGDTKLPIEQRPSWAPFQNYKPDSPLQPSGLLGPVLIQSAK